MTTDRQTCRQCGAMCCRTIAVKVDATTDAQRDYLATRGRVHAGFWYLPTRCRHLTGTRCTIYERRPVVCREYAVGGELCMATREAMG